MTGMQEKILAEVRKIIEDAGLEYVVQPRFANTGNVYAMDGLRTVAGFDYDFQDHYGSLKKLTPSGRGGAGDVGGNFQYHDQERIEQALNRVRAMVSLGEEEAAHRFTVTVRGCTAEQAAQVMAERISPDEDYGFDYRISWEG